MGILEKIKQEQQDLGIQKAFSVCFSEKNPYRDLLKKKFKQQITVQQFNTDSSERYYAHIFSLKPRYVVEKSVVKWLECYSWNTMIMTRILWVMRRELWQDVGKRKKIREVLKNFAKIQKQIRIDLKKRSWGIDISIDTNSIFAR